LSVLYSAAPWRHASVKTGFQSLSFRHFVLCQFCIPLRRGAVRLLKPASRVCLAAILFHVSSVFRRTVALCVCINRLLESVLPQFCSIPY
jgi:hypothetical protein